MGNGATNIGSARDEADETYVTVDRRGVILDLPDVADVTSLRLARGHTETVVVPPCARSNAHASLSAVSRPSRPVSFWMRWPFRTTTKERGD